MRVGGFGHSGGLAAERGACRGLGVDDVGLAPRAPRLTVRSVELHHLCAGGCETAGEPRAVGAGALHADACDRPVRLQPCEQRAVLGRVRRERLHPQQSTGRIGGRGHMGVAVGVHPADDTRSIIWHDQSALLGNSDGSGTTGPTADSALRVLGPTLLSGHILRPAGARPRRVTGRQIVCKAHGQRRAESDPQPVEDTTNTMSAKRRNSNAVQSGLRFLGLRSATGRTRNHLGSGLGAPALRLRRVLV